MSLRSAKRLSRLGVMLMLGLGVHLNVTVWGQSTKPLSLQEVIDNSDQIMMGTCTERSTGIENGIVVTHYKVKPQEFWKGTRTLSKDGDFAMSEVGGVLENSPVPLAQYVPGANDMLPGEDVLLFLADPKPSTRPAKVRAGRAQKTAATADTLATSPYVVGLWQGRYNVVTNPRSGQRMIARSNINAVPGSPLNTAMREKLLKAQGVKSTTNDQGAHVMVREKKPAITPEKLLVLSKRLENAEHQARQAHEELARKTPAAADEIYQFESVDAVKARVMRLAKGSRK